MNHRRALLPLAFLAVGAVALASYSSPDTAARETRPSSQRPANKVENWNLAVTPEEFNLLIEEPDEILPESEPDALADFIDDQLLSRILASDWADDYTHHEIRHRDTPSQEVVFFGKRNAPAALQQQISAAAAKKATAVEFDGTVLLSPDEYIAKIDAAYAAISPGRSKFGAISHDSRYSIVELGVWEAPDAQRTVEALTRALAPLTLHATVQARPAPVDSDYASRSNDTTPFMTDTRTRFL